MAMENPVAYMENKDTALASTLKETGGLGTVATRADIIEKLFASGLIEPADKYLRITQKGRQLLELAPKDLRTPTLTAKWEMALTQISKGQLKKEAFLKDIEAYTKAIITEIKNSDSHYRHDNLTQHKCPDCQKNMLEIKGKKGKYLVCQDRECGHRKTLETTTNARCPNCHKKLVLTGGKDKQMFVCKCGHKEKMEKFKERKAQQGNKMHKKDIQKFLDKTNKEVDGGNNAFANAFANLKFD